VLVSTGAISRQLTAKFFFKHFEVAFLLEQLLKIDKEVK